MDGIPFDRERYRLGHTLVFFRAGSLGGLEEERDKLVIRWVRYIQGEVLRRVRGFVYKKKFDQRELIKVGQRNFRKYLDSRDWGWFILIQKTRGSIGQDNPEEALRQLEEKANATWGKYQEALAVTANLSGSMDALKDDIKAMGKQLSEEQGNISVYTDRQAKATATKATAEAELRDAAAVLSSEESSRVELSAEVKSHSGSVNVVKKEIEDIELAISKVELEKGNRDHTIKVLQDEIAEQDEVINKLNKEKKHIAETQAKSNDDMITVNEKVGHLNSVKSKLESTLDELEGGLDKEKKGRAALEKTKRKVEGDLKMSQDGVAELERAKRDYEVVIGNKDKNNAQLAAKLDDEQNLVAKAQKGIKEIQGRVEAMEEELEAERQARAKAERQRSDLAREIDSLGERLDEASGATTAQVELNKKRDAEVNKLRKDVEEANIQQESILGNLKRKQGDAIAEMSEQIDALGKMKSKIEKDKGQIMNEIADARAATDEVMRAQASSDKSNKTMLEGLNAINKKVDNANLTLGDFAASKNKIAVENSDLLRIVGDLDNNLNILAKQKAALAAQLNDVKALCDNEARERGLLLGKYRNLEHELDGAREALDEEAAGRENTLRLCAKAEAESQCWRQKYETDAVAKGEELEMTRMKLTARLTEAEAAIDNLSAKLAQVEKAKGKIASESSDMANSLDQAQVLNAAMERKAKQFDKVISEWKGKVDRLSFDLDVSQKETRNASSELFKVKSAYEETMLQLEEVRRENKTLSNEIKDIMDQISEGGRSIHEIDKIRKRLEAEKLELQSALEEAEATLEQEENKVLRCQLELNAVRQEIERRLAEKEEEFLLVKKAQSKALDSMQVALETETKSKAEALRMKKKLEGDAADLGLALEHAIAGNAETQTTIKKYALQVRDAQGKVDDESMAKSAAADAKVTGDRRAAAMQNGLEEARALLETADRQRRAAEQELADTNETLADLTNVNQSITASKRKLEVELGQLNADLDEMTNEARMSEDKAARAMVDAARLADELRCEQELAMNLEKDKKLLEAQCKDAATRADEAEVNALKGGRKAMIKMETRIRELESELDAETRRFGDCTKNLRKSERSIKELTFACDEDRKNHERMQALIDQLQGKVKSYKKQIEEAEEIAALNLAKYRKVAGALGDAESSADANEQAMAMRKARAKSASLGL
jgi:myosin heavy chain 6/7